MAEGIAIAANMGQITQCLAAAVSAIESDLKAAENRKDGQPGGSGSQDLGALARKLVAQIDDFDTSASDTCAELAA